MIDFQALHAKQLTVYREYSRVRPRIVQPVLRAVHKIEGIKSNTLLVNRTFQKKGSLMDKNLMGQRVNLLI
jgi:hypothetical protein